MKHNKKRNTAFIFEVLVRELTKSIIEKDAKQKKIILSLIKENFKSNSALGRELELYKALLETQGIEIDVAEKLIFECRMQRCTIDHKQLFCEQTTLISKINKHISKSAFTIFLPNYRNVASVYQIFNPNTKTKQRVLLEKQIINQMVIKENKEEQLLQPISNLTLKTFVKNFNHKYADGLINEQKKLLHKYISSFHDGGTEMRVFLNEEIERLKIEIQHSLKLEEIQNDSDMFQKTKDVLNILNNTSKRPIDSPLIQDILKIQNLVKEIKH